MDGNSYSECSNPGPCSSLTHWIFKYVCSIQNTTQVRKLTRATGGGCSQRKGDRNSGINGHRRIMKLGYIGVGEEREEYSRGKKTGRTINAKEVLKNLCNLLP